MIDKNGIKINVDTNAKKIYLINYYVLKDICGTLVHACVNVIDIVKRVNI